MLLKVRETLLLTVVSSNMFHCFKAAWDMSHSQEVDCPVDGSRSPYVFYVKYKHICWSKVGEDRGEVLREMIREGVARHTALVFIKRGAVRGRLSVSASKPIK